jgi:4,5-DOPA dioxygenase extradiol
MPKPRAILIVSAHWEDAPLAISNPALGTPLVYDFGGFADRYYTMRYPTPSAAQLARDVQALFSDARLHQSHRGLDHGAWVPLKARYPRADVPVLQLSMPSGDPEALYELGRRLQVLREQGVLVVGSGHMTHGLRWFNRKMLEGFVPRWSADFDAWAIDAVRRGAIDELADYRSAPGMPYSHPTADHFLPIFITLGAVNGRCDMIAAGVDGYTVGFSRRSFALS